MKGASSLLQGESSKLEVKSNQYNLIMASCKYLCYLFFTSSLSKKALLVQWLWGKKVFLLAYFAKIKPLLMMRGFSRGEDKREREAKKVLLHSCSACLASWHFAWNFQVIRRSDPALDENKAQFFLLAICTSTMRPNLLIAWRLLFLFCCSSRFFSGLHFWIRKLMKV